MFLRILYTYCLILVMFCLGMTGCTNHYSEEEIDDTYNGSVYLTLHINTALKENTRSNPNGGEFGDGDEIGVYNENTIDKLVFFFFRADQATGGIDHSDKPENIEVITEFCEAPAVINQSNRLEWSTQPIELKNIVAGYEYYMVVVANAYSFQMSDIKTLKDLQDYQFSDNLWQTSIDITNYNRFIMTSRFRDAQAMAQAKVSITYANDQTNPATGVAYLERLAARVDIIPRTEKNGASWNSDGKYYQYPVKDTEDNVYLYGIQLINKYNQGSYLLKHIADVTAQGEINSIKRIGKETPDSGNQTNYVVDPNTVNKTGNKEPLWYDNYYMDDFGWNEMPAVTKNGEHYILDYTRENTLLKQYQTEKHYITALHLQCVYVPNGYIAGETFYTYKNIRYQNKNTLLAAVIKDQPNANLSNVTEAEGVIVYENGKCYFTYYIRHSEDNNATEDGIMKYGIVRNNIYRVTINSFSGIGSEDKYDPIPITKNVEFTIWVVPWNVIENPEIIL